MKKFLVLSAVVSLLVGVLAGAFITLHASTSTARANGQRVIHVIEHANTDTVQHFVQGQDSIGDALGFANPVYDAQDKKQVGSDNGHCVRTVPGVAWECFWTVFLTSGQITVEGPYYDNPKHDSMLAITGGTGLYMEARGQMKLHDHFGDATQYDFTYMLAN
jgi:allene oxide cyclase